MSIIVRPTVRQIVQATRNRIDRGGLPWEWEEGGVAYDPSREDGYFLDWWAEYGVTEAGTGVASWIDRASGMDATNAIDATRPTYQAAGLGGRPTVRFEEASDDVLNVSSISNASTSWTVYAFMDLKGLKLSTTNRLFDSQSGRLTVQATVLSSYAIGWYDGAYKNVGVNATTGAQVLTWVLSAGSNGEVFRGSTSLGTAPYTPKSLGGAFGIGNHFGTVGGNCIDAAIGRLLVYAAAHDAAARQRVWAWGAAHYGISL